MQNRLTITPDSALTPHRQSEVLERVRLLFRNDKEVRVEISYCPSCGLEDHPHQTCTEADVAETIAERGTAKAGAADPPCWHRNIDDAGMCRDCGKRAAIHLDQAPVPAESMMEERGEEEPDADNLEPGDRLIIDALNQMADERDAARSALREAEQGLQESEELNAKLILRAHDSEQREADLRRECAEVLTPFATVGYAIPTGHVRENEGWTPLKSILTLYWNNAAALHARLTSEPRNPEFEHHDHTTWITPLEDFRAKRGDGIPLDNGIPPAEEV